jgi:hypothetical protein
MERNHRPRNPRKMGRLFPLHIRAIFWHPHRRIRRPQYRTNPLP